MGQAVEAKKFIGVLNYIKALLSSDFWTALGTTAVYTAATVVVEFGLGLAVALLLNGEFVGRSVVRSIAIIPLAVTPVVVGLVWRVLYNTDYGLINFILHELGLPTSKWIAGMSTALISVVIVDIWQWTPFATLILLAGLQTVPIDVLEASKIDGASGLQRFRYVTLAFLRTPILVVLLFRTIDSFKVFDNIYALTMGGPGSATETLSMHLYIQGFRNRHMGYASAMGILFLIVVTLICQLFIRVIDNQGTSSNDGSRTRR
jgi:multiple sugar transport system permease protein